VPPQSEQTVPITTEYITLGQLLQHSGVVASGGEAKFYLSQMVVQVNGEDEQRRGRKLYPGDRILAPGSAPIRLITQNPEDEAEEE
jgi:S4 domain protein YaaA